MIKDMLWVALGGMAGSVSRYLIQCAMQMWLASHSLLRGRVSIPWGTLVVNVLGCFLIGAIVTLIARHTTDNSSHWALLLLSTGFCGGFTTFSSFALEGIQLIRQGDLLEATLYLGGSLVLGFLALFVALILFGKV